MLQETIDVDDAGPDAGDAERATRLELTKEATTMALYVAVSAFAALLAVSEDADAHQPLVLTLVWGTTLGLALAHWFAFRVAARLVGGGRIGLDDLWISLAQLAGAAVVAIVVTVPVVVLPTTAEFDVARVVLAGFIALVGYRIARVAGFNHVRSLGGAGSTLAIGVAVALVKNVLSGH